MVAKNISPNTNKASGPRVGVVAELRPSSNSALLLSQCDIGRQRANDTPEELATYVGRDYILGAALAELLCIDKMPLAATAFCTRISEFVAKGFEAEAAEEEALLTGRA